jgi:hypothetical protein
MSNWNFWEQTEYTSTHQQYFDDRGMMVIDMHVDWHHNNDSGGRNGKGSGTAFLGMHRSMMNDFRAFALAHGLRSWVPIDVTATLPYAVGDAAGPLMSIGQDYYDTWYYPRSGTDSAVFMPPYLTASGGAAVGIWGSSFWLIDLATGERTSPIWSKLNDIADLDTLGQVIGMSTFHGSVHHAIGGTMGDLASPSDPLFYAWHGLIDQIADNWLKTTAGRNWIAAHPGHPFLQTGYTDMNGWDDAYWATQPP